MGEPASAWTDFVDGGSNPGEDGLGRGHLAAAPSRPEMDTPGGVRGLPGGFWFPFLEASGLFWSTDLLGRFWEGVPTCAESPRQPWGICRMTVIFELSTGGGGGW
jgi:hypothetical protein